MMAEEDADITSNLISEVGGEEAGIASSRFTGATRLGTVERLNLINLAKLCIKRVIAFTSTQGTSIDDFSPQIQELFILLESCMRHRLKAKRNLLSSSRTSSLLSSSRTSSLLSSLSSGRKDYWSLVESFERGSPELAETIVAVRALPNIRTNLGRGRAWLRWSLMQKRLADFFKALVERKNIVSEWYDPEAFLLNEEGVVMGGLLMGLNVIDYNVIMKGEDYDRPLGVVDLSLYLREGNYLARPPDEGEPESSAETDKTDATALTRLMDQKAFLEERNKKLESMVEKLQRDLDTKRAESEGLAATLRSLETAASEATSEKEKLKILVDRSSEDMERVLQSFQDDREIERDTLSTAREGIKDLYSASQKQLDMEMKLRLDLERQLEVQRSLRMEKETALSLLEKDVLEKQASIVSLRQQLDEMKAVNVKMQGQLQHQKQSSQDQSTRVKTAEARVGQLSSQNKQLEHSLTQSKSAVKDLERVAAEMGAKMQQLQLHVDNLESDLKIEKEWRESTRGELQREKDRNVELQQDSRKLKTMQSEYGELQERYATLQDTVNEQEQALAEMAESLSESKQHMADLKHSSAMFMSQKWTDDKDISSCQGCQKEFSVARRKHHCRACGGIFCSSCSDNNMNLSSSSKPVRVCDSCFTLLQQKASLSAGATSTMST